MTIGDVFSVVASIFGIFLTSWATIVAVSLLLPNAAERARRATAEPGRAIFRGLVIFLTLGIVGFAMFVSPAPLIKTFGLLILLTLLGIAAVGSSGIAQEAGRRIQAMDPTMPAYPSLVRGAAYVVGATILPVLGWFGFGPLLFLASLGAGWKAVVAIPGRARAGETA
jgi:hypothetical protein